MRLAISNMAWDIDEDEKIANLLNRYNLDAIDIVPGKYFLDPANVTDDEISHVKDWWLCRGIEITGMQALLFGTSGLNIFGSQESQNAMLKHLSAICRIGKGLGATRLVFGSPKSRDCSGFTEKGAMKVALTFFRELGKAAEANGVIICLEPNPSCYGANFMTTSAQTADVVRRVGHSAIQMQLDSGAITINKEDVASIVQDYASIIGHVHASEPDLVPLGDGKADHSELFLALEKSLSSHIISIEMLATKTEPHEVSIERALGIAVHHYRNSVRKSKV